MSEFETEFLTLVFVALLAFLAPPIAKRLKAPVVVSEIILGMAVGLAAFTARHFLGGEALSTGVELAFLAEIGFIILLFLAGLEIDFNKLEDRGPMPVVIGLAVFALTLGVAYLSVRMIGTYLGQEFGFFTAMMLSTTSVGIVVPTLREARLAQSGFGQNIIITALIADFGTMLLLTIFSLTQEAGGGHGGGGSEWLGFPVAYLLLPLFFVIFYVVYRIGGMIMWHKPEVFSKFFRTEDPTEGGVRGTLALMFLFVLLSIQFGVEVILGSFLAGTMISLLFRQASLLEEKLYGIGYGFFVPIFFIHLGMNFNFAAVADRAALILLPALLFFAFVIKIVPSLLWLPQYGVRRVLAMGSINSARLTLMIAAASIGLRLGIFDETLYSAVIVLAIATSAIGPVAFRILMGKDPLLERQKVPTTAGGGTDE